MKRARVQAWTGFVARWVSAGLGIWLMFAPAALGYGDPADSSDRFAGPLIATFSICAAWAVVGGLRWLNLLAAAWLLLAPWLLGFPTRAAINSVVVGLLVAMLSLIPLRSAHTFGGGWRAAFR